MGQPKKTKPKPPTPTTTSAISLTKVYLYIGPDGFGNYIWFDDDLNGWRYGVIKDGGVSETTGQAVYQWIVQKGKPFGVTSDDWLHHRKTDAQYRTDIDNAYLKDQDALGLNENPYNPWDPADPLSPQFKQSYLEFVKASHQ